jgi:outer membrane protein assembly factor BamB
MKPRALPLFGLALLAGAAAAADWPQWRGPDRTDISKETGLLKEWPKDGPKLLWTYRDAGVGFSGMAVVGDRLYSMGAWDGKEHVFAVDLTTQKQLWSVEVGKMYTEGHGDGPRCTPTVDCDLVYALGGEGNLVCVKAGGGEKVWSKDLVKDLGGSRPGWGYTESPLVDDNRLIVTPGGKKGTLAALDKKTGEVLWRSTEFTDGAQYSSVIVAEIGGVRQYVQLTGASVAGVSPRDGKLLWRADRSGRTATIPTPVVKDNYVFVTSGYGVGCNLFKVSGDADTGFKAAQVYASKTMVNHHGGVLLVGDHLYGFSDGPGWVCQELATGKEVWSKNGVGKGSVTCADGMLYCYGERNGDVALVEATPAGYKEHGRFSIPEKAKVSGNRGSIWTHPTVANGKLYLRDHSLIFCYDVSAK